MQILYFYFHFHFSVRQCRHGETLVETFDDTLLLVSVLFVSELVLSSQGWKSGWLFCFELLAAKLRAKAPSAKTKLSVTSVPNVPTH